jgi:hypothetical protein
VFFSKIIRFYFIGAVSRLFFQIQIFPDFNWNFQKRGMSVLLQRSFVTLPLPVFIPPTPPISKTFGKFHLSTTLPLLRIIVPTKALRNIKFTTNKNLVSNDGC